MPPYFPDLNPIEEAFAELKAWCKKHHSEAEKIELKEFLEYAIENVKDGAHGHFFVVRLANQFVKGQRRTTGMTSQDMNILRHD